MSTVEKQFVESEYDGVRFPQERTAGVLLGLTWDQLIVVGFGAVFLLVSLFRGGWAIAWGVVVLAVCTAFGVVRFRGRSLPAWVAVGLRYAKRGAGDQLEYRQGLSPAHELKLLDGEPQVRALEVEQKATRTPKGAIKPGNPTRFRLPGGASELKAYALPNGAGFVWDPHEREAVICAKVITSRGFSLESFDAQEERSLSWGAALAGLSRMPGVVRVQASDQTTLISGSAVQGFYESKQEQSGMNAAEVDPFLDQAFKELMKEAQSMPVHEQWLSVVVSPAQIGSRLKGMGGGLPALMEYTLKLMTTIEGHLPRSGTRVAAWHSPRSLAALSRAAFDPDSSVTVTMTGEDGELRGTAPASAGPMAVDVHPGYLEMDGYVHRTFKIAELPQETARLGFLDELVFSGDFRHTVTVVMSPVDRGKAMRATRGRRSSWESDSRTLRAMDRPPSPEHEQELVDIMREQDELMRRHASLDMVVLVTVTARSLSELEAASNDVVTDAIATGCELRPLWLEQDSAFMAAALPFGRIKL